MHDSLGGLVSILSFRFVLVLRGNPHAAAEALMLLGKPKHERAHHRTFSKPTNYNINPGLNPRPPPPLPGPCRARTALEGPSLCLAELLSLFLCFSISLLFA